MAKQTFEAQAAAVRGLMKGRISDAERETLRQVESTLNDLAKLRSRCLEEARTAVNGDISEDLADEFVKLLHLPTGE